MCDEILTDPADVAYRSIQSDCKLRFLQELVTATVRTKKVENTNRYEPGKFAGTNYQDTKLERLTYLAI